MRPAPLSARAKSDLRKAVKWIAVENPTAARALRQAVAIAAKKISEFPLIAPARPELADAPYRILTLPPFPYVVVYNADRKPPVIMRILHGARDLPEVLSDL